MNENISNTDPRLTHLAWMDLEMSGLEPDRDVILEIATLVTNADLDLIAEGPVLAISWPREVVDTMDDWNREHHGKSGLTQRVLESRTMLREAEQQTLEFLRKHTVCRASPLCGNSIGQDRRFLYRYMPEVSEWLHYRSVDVSTIKELANRWYPGMEPFAKRKSHQALDDIRESIDELRWYRKHLFVESPRG